MNKPIVRMQIVGLIFTELSVSPVVARAIWVTVFILRQLREYLFDRTRPPLRMVLVHHRGFSFNILTVVRVPLLASVENFHLKEPFHSGEGVPVGVDRLVGPVAGQS